MNIKKSVVAVMIAGFLTLGAGTAHAGWSLTKSCTDGDITYKLFENGSSYGLKQCESDGSCAWRYQGTNQAKADKISTCDLQ